MRGGILVNKLRGEMPVLLFKLGLMVLAVFLAFYTNLGFGKVAAGIITLYCIISTFQLKLSKWIAAVGIVVLCVYSIMYFKLTMVPYLDKTDSTQHFQLAQLTIPRSWDKHDMWLSAIVRGKTVNLTYAAEWCHEYFKEFAAETVIDEGGLQHVPEIDSELMGKYYIWLETMTFAGTRDLFEAEALTALSEQELQPQLLLSGRDLIDAEVIYVLTDETNFMFLSSGETLEKVLEENAN